MWKTSYHLLGTTLNNLKKHINPANTFFYTAKVDVRDLQFHFSVAQLMLHTIQLQKPNAFM